MIGFADEMFEIERLKKRLEARDKTYRNALEAYFLGRCSETDLSFAYVMRRQSLCELHRVICDMKAHMRAQQREADFRKINRLLEIVDGAIHGDGERDSDNLYNGLAVSA